MFEDRPVRGPLFVYLDVETGDPTAIGCEEAGATGLGSRLRFWVPSFAPEDRPSYDRGGPRSRVAPSRPVPEGDREAYFERLLGAISDSAFVRERYDDDPERPDVVATTNNSAADLPDDSFDLAVVDEATQATVQSTFVPFTKAGTLIHAGDHGQLPPYSATDEPDDDRYRSLFERLYPEDGVYGPSIGVLLTAQYRMHPDVAAFPNRSFYGGGLENGGEVTPVDGLPPLVGVDVAGRERRGDGHSYYNREEASEVASLVERLLDADVTPDEVGVITPYEAQVEVVEDELRELPGNDDVDVDTVDSFPGSEREAVVVSFVRSNERGDVGILGRTPDGPRRLNVALTRAERFCGLVGDWYTLREGGNGRNGCTDLYRDLYERVAEDGRVYERGGADRPPGGDGTPRGS